MARVLIVYASRKGATQKIAEIIAEGLRFSAVEVTLRDAKEIKNVKDLADFDGYVFGSSTYHGEMMKSMKSLLFLAEQADFKGKAGGSFGSYGWSGEAAERIYDTMANIFEMNMVSAPLMLKSTAVDNGVKVAQDYGKEIAAKI